MYSIGILLAIVEIIIIMIIYEKVKAPKELTITDKLNGLIERGIDSGIKNVIHHDSYHISIFFNNGISLIECWDENKLYAWLHKGKVYINNKLELEFNDNTPSLRIKKLLNKLIERFDRRKYENSIIPRNI